MKNQRKLRSYFINPDFQGKFIAIFLIFACFQAFVNYYVVYFSFKQIRETVEQSFTTATPASSELIEMIGLQEFYVISFMGFAYTMSFLVFVIVGVRFTHSAAGALHRFKSDFSEMADKKKLRRISLRKTDFFHDVEDSFNKLVDEIEGK